MPNVAAVRRIESFLDDEPDHEYGEDYLGVGLDADDIDSFEWLLAHAPSNPAARFIDVWHPLTVVALFPRVASLLAAFGLKVLDRRALADERRGFTRRLGGLMRGDATHRRRRTAGGRPPLRKSARARVGVLGTLGAPSPRCQPGDHDAGRHQHARASPGGRAARRSPAFLGSDARLRTKRGYAARSRLSRCPGSRTPRTAAALPSRCALLGGTLGTRRASNRPRCMSSSQANNTRWRPVYSISSGAADGCQSWPVSSRSAAFRNRSRWSSSWQMNMTYGRSPSAKVFAATTSTGTCRSAGTSRSSCRRASFCRTR
jgi:hypothetical protein